MIRKTCIAVLLFSLATPALAAPRCERPYAPEISDLKNTTALQISTIRDDVRTFIAASDIYQACLVKNANGDAASQREVSSLIDANQRDKQRVGTRFNALLRAHKLANTQTRSSSDVALATP